MRFTRVAVLAALSAVTAAVASAQLNSTAFLGTTNTIQWEAEGSVNTYVGDYSDTGAPVSVDASGDFSGLDQNGDEQTATFSGTGTASAQYGRLRTSAWGQVENTFYNGENAENGDPNMFVSVGQASFTDVLQYEHASMTQDWVVRYLYHVDGYVAGLDSYGSLYLDIGGNGENFFYDSPGVINETVATNTYTLSGNFSHEVSTTFLSSFFSDTQFYADGSTVEGSAGFGQTITLVGIEMFDGSGNQITDFSVTSASGTIYPVPEPMTMSLLGLGLAGLAARRRRKA